MLSVGHRRALPAALLALLGALCATSAAQALDAVTLPKVGACPSGYTTSGYYCRPGKQARYAIVVSGACPSGYQVSGNYCLAGQRARHALPNSGPCPNGYAVSGAYCLAVKAR